MVKGSKTSGRSFSQTLREARQEKGASQEELADRAGLHRTYILRLKEASASFAGSLEQIAQALDMSTAALLARMER